MSTKKIWGGKVVTLIRPPSGGIYPLPPEVDPPSGTVDETYLSQQEELANIPDDLLFKEVEKRKLKKNFQLEDVIKDPRSFVASFEKRLLDSEKETTGFHFALRSGINQHTVQEAYFFPAGYSGACPAVSVQISKTSGMGSIAINAAIIDCSTVESFQTKLRIDQTSKKSWARNMFRKVIPLLNSKKSQSVNEAHIFGEIDGDSTEKSRLACLYFHDKWTAVSEKNSGKEYDLKEHGIGLTNIGKIIKSMNIKRVAKFSTP